MGAKTSAVVPTQERETRQRGGRIGEHSDTSFPPSASVPHGSTGKHCDATHQQPQTTRYSTRAHSRAPSRSALHHLLSLLSSHFVCTPPACQTHCGTTRDVSLTSTALSSPTHLGHAEGVIGAHNNADLGGNKHTRDMHEAHLCSGIADKASCRLTSRGRHLLSVTQIHRFGSMDLAIAAAPISCTLLSGSSEAHTPHSLAPVVSS